MALTVTIEEYEKFTGALVPEAMRETTQARLDVTCQIVDIYLSPWGDAFDEARHDVLAYVVSMHALRMETIPAGVRSESVGSTSVSYMDNAGDPLALSLSERDLLDSLLLGGGRRRRAESVLIRLG